MKKRFIFVSILVLFSLGAIVFIYGPVLLANGSRTKNLSPVGNTRRTTSSSSTASSSNGFSAATCNSPLLRRGQYTREWAESITREYLGTPPRTSVINEECPRFVYAFQNHNAGFGHRLTNWVMALHTAVVLNLTFTHTSFDGGSGQHGNYNGWDSWLSFTKGEHGLDDVVKRPGSGRKELPSVGGYYGYNEKVIASWKPFVENSPCNTVFQIPSDQWMYDISSTTRALMAIKFEQYAVPNPPSSLPEWNDNDINIAVHVRFGDQYPTNERVHARIISDTILPALEEAGVKSRIAIHIFAEDKVGGSLPALEAINQNIKGKNIVLFYHPKADPRTSFWHLTQCDFLVMSFSSFSWAAAQVSLKPLAYAQPSSDIMKMCSEASVCCEHSGQCGFVARHRTRETAFRLAAREAACGSL